MIGIWKEKCSSIQKIRAAYGKIPEEIRKEECTNEEKCVGCPDSDSLSDA